MLTATASAPHPRELVTLDGLAGFLAQIPFTATFLATGAGVPVEVVYALDRGHEVEYRHAMAVVEALRQFTDVREVA